jgi:2-dehydropantoate 2-reductase
MGAGAVGCYFGGMLARAGAPVTLIGRRAHVEAIAREGLFIDSIHFQERVELAASTQPEAARDAAFILFCVKTLDTEEAARSLKPHVSPGALVLSLQNGVDNAERIRSASGIDALPTVVYVAAEITAPGRVKHAGRGDLVAGCLPGQENHLSELSRAAEAFVRAGVPCRVSDNIQADLWTKLAFNCAGNAVTTLGRSSYGQAARHPLAREVIRAVVDEAVAVAHAVGIHLPGSSLAEEGFKIAEKMDNAISSTAQDISRGKRTEIDSLNGYLVRRGRELGVPTPVNHTLYALIKLLEETGRQASSARNFPRTQCSPGSLS